MNRRIKKSIICCIIVLTLIFISINNSMAAEYDSIIPALSQAIEEAMQQANITGLSVALVDDQEIVWAEGFGYADKTNDIKATPETLYRVASVSKLLTATAIMQLVDQGKIDLDQPLQTYLPEFSVKSRFPDAEPITVRHLLTHHSGLPSDWINGMQTEGDDQQALVERTFATLLDEIKDTYVANPPNTVFSYSNLGYSVLGHVIEKVTGQEFSAYVDEALLKPLGMPASSFAFTPDMAPSLSKEYQNGEEQEYNWSRDIPAAMLHSTVLDLGQFMRMMFADGKAGSQQILQPQTVAEMWRPQNEGVPLDFDAHWGLSWWLVDLGLGYAGKMAWHSGGEGMWNSLLVTLPEHKLGVVVLSNSAEAEAINYQIAPKILEHALEVKTGITRPPVELLEVVALSPDVMHTYEGLYTTESVGPIRIRSEGTYLYADAMGNPFKLLHHGEGRFSIEGVDGAELEIKTVNGRTALKLYGHAVGGLGFGERIEPGPLSEVWQDRLGAYEIINGNPDYVTFLTDIQLKYDRGVLVFDVMLPLLGMRVGLPMKPLSDTDAITLGLGRNCGETISVVEVDGEEHLFWSGYLMKKTGSVEKKPTADNVYADPQGRFSMPLIGNWTQVETDKADALFEVPGLDLNMYVVTVASDDLEAGGDAALKQAGFDPATLTQTNTTRFGNWDIIFYLREEGQGVTILAQIKEDTTYCLIVTGDEGLTQNPPDHVMKTIQAFRLAGEEVVLPTTVDAFEAYVNSFVGDIPPGLSMIITLNGESLYAKGFGLADAPKGMAAEPDTVFAWGSMVKIVTATALMQLYEQGLIDLDAPVSDYLNYFPAEYGITVRHLLTHSAGLGEPPEFVPVNLRIDGQPLPDPDLVVKQYVEQFPGLMFEPGSASSYSNPGFVVLGQIVAEMSGQSYIEYVREHILVPLGMQNTDFTYSSAAMIEKAAAGAFPATQIEDLIARAKHAGGPVSGADLIREVDEQYAWMNRYNVLAAHGGLAGPPIEVMRFAQMHLNGGELDGVRILSPESVALMQEMQHSTSGDPLGVGLAWFVFDDGEHTYIEHDGGGVGIWDKMRLYPQDGLAIVLMSNASGWERDRVGDAAANVVFSMLGGGAQQEAQAASGAAAKIQAPDYQKIIDEVLQDDRPGIALRVKTPEFEYFETRGYADWENKIPLEKDHLFRIASCTKTFIATLTLMLHVEGKLNLDDTITRYLPESITSHIQYADRITIRQLLNHSSGIFDTADNPEWWAAQFENPTKEWTDTEALEFAYDQPAYFEPGTGYTYSNTNYQLTGLILDQVVGHHHSEEVRSRILSPLGLNSTFYEQHEEFDRQKLSHGYFDFDGDGIAEDYYDLRIDTGHADGGLISTVEDMAVFMTALFKKQDFPDAGYREQFLQELLKLQPVASQEPKQIGAGPGIADYDYGYGKGYGHTGGNPGYLANMIYFPDRDVTFALTWNGIDGGFESIGTVPSLYESLIEATFSALGIEKTLDEKDAQAGNVYTDPQARFSIPLVGDWTPVESADAFVHFTQAEPAVNMYIVAVDSADVNAGIETALTEIDIDSSALTLLDAGGFGKWTLLFYALDAEQGVTILAQVRDDTTYSLIFTGGSDVTRRPPSEVMETIEGFAFAGEGDGVALPATVEEFEAYANSVVEALPPGLSIVIAANGAVAYANGFGVADGPLAMAATPDTVYPWASMTKIATVTAIMQLYEQGRLDLDDPVADYLDYFPADYPITVRQLLDHSAGLSDPLELVLQKFNLDGEPKPDPDEAARTYYAQFAGPMFEPGSESAYANMNFLTLGEIVAAISGQSYIEYVREHILGPLGMTQTDFTYSEAMIANAAAGAIPATQTENMVTALDQARGLGDGADFIRETGEQFSWMNRYNIFAPWGGLIGPATDVMRFAQMHLNGGELDGVRILSPESVALMQERQLSTAGNPLGRGLGWEIANDTERLSVQHSGSGAGVQALMRLYPNEGVAVVLMSNAVGYEEETVVDAAANVLFSMLGY
ncbi:MAG: beta-lactamase family protein [bacterium]|nr:beta-lactamase family protein [bacterium]